MRKSFVPAVLFISFALSACGVRGDLETPPPLWGDKEKPEQSEDQGDPPSTE